MKLPLTAPPFAGLMAEFAELDAAQQVALFADAAPVDEKGRYLPWDEARHRQPPEGLSPRLNWLRMVMPRRGGSQTLPLRGRGGQPFWFCNVSPLVEILHGLDQAQQTHVLGNETLMTNAVRRRWLQRGLMDEAIQSSQLEGANTSHQIAQEMLREGRPPRDHGERMIANNFAAMQTVEQWAARRRACGSCTHPAPAPASSRPGQCAMNGIQGGCSNPARPASTWSRPVSTSSTSRRRQTSCPNVCNASVSSPRASPTVGFLHPIVRAILVHFMIGYDHPFVDGNGRTARALFYWSLLRSGWWLAPYLPISHFLLRAPAQYSRAYQYVTADNNDATHFILHQLDIMERALTQLDHDLQEQAAAARDLVEQLGDSGFGERELAILDAALKQPNRIFTIAQQQNEHRVSYWAARADLQDLAERGYLLRGTLRQEVPLPPRPRSPRPSRQIHAVTC